MNAETSKAFTFFVPVSRLSRGKCIGNSFVGEGDIMGSYSADRIGEGRPVRKPFQFQGSLWVCTGGLWSGAGDSKNEADAYRLVPKERFEGQPQSYRERTATEDLREQAREDPMGFYHGVVVKFRSAGYVLCGPKALFKADPEQFESDGTDAVQLRLF